MRAPWGKGVAYTEVDGRGVVYITTPAFFLYALDAETGRPLENWGTPVPLEGFRRPAWWISCPTSWPIGVRGRSGTSHMTPITGSRWNSGTSRTLHRRSS